MRSFASEPVGAGGVLNRNRNLVLNLSDPESKIKKKIKIKRGTQ